MSHLSYLSYLSPAARKGMMKRNDLNNDERIRLGLARLDETATTYERKWGADRLQNLVDQELAETFQRQLSKLNAALIVTAQVADGRAAG